MPSTEKKDGGPAFACAAENGHQEGMSLRDWFAGQALVGMLSDGRSTNPRNTINSAELARHAYNFADAMLTEREK